MNQEKILERLDQLITQGEEVVNSCKEDHFGGEWVDSDLMYGFRAPSLSLIERIYKKDSPFFQEFDKSTNNSHPENAKSGIEILKAIKGEIEGGWIFTLRGIVSSDIFADFLEASEHLLQEGYKDAAAVMIGGVLEQNLRELCLKNGIGTTESRKGVPVAKKADRLNQDLAKADIYGKLDQKNVTAWLGLRNNAAHANYGEYTKEQVDLMLENVSNFLARVNT